MGFCILCINIVCWVNYLNSVNLGFLIYNICIMVVIPRMDIKWTNFVYASIQHMVPDYVSDNQ